ncbi:hypothetical protein RWE15_09010 [Virgibacillus halophilus]|uniref:Uncharacterized protein n=1 Tax=Tigheibacillus halophilus TaxID=361280 RepID=A0ABU5C660_9BACI|nr:hypothetical protein [Virgibacillus halophilus]
MGYIRFTMGYAGYFLIVFMSFRALLVQDDWAAFIILFAGSFLLINYVQFLEKKTRET